MTNSDADTEYQSCACITPTYEERLFAPKDLSWGRFCNMIEGNVSREVVERNVNREVTERNVSREVTERNVSREVTERNVSREVALIPAVLMFL